MSDPNPSRQRISSRGSRFFKYGFPALWFGFLGIFFVTALISAVRRSSSFWLPALAITVVMAAFGSFLFRRLLFDLADEVLDAGTFLIARKGRIEERVALTNIMNISYSVMTSPPRVTLTLRTPGRLGKEVSFTPPATLVPFAKSRAIVDLIERIDRARGGSSGWGRPE